MNETIIVPSSTGYHTYTLDEVREAIDATILKMTTPRRYNQEELDEVKKLLLEELSKKGDRSNGEQTKDCPGR